jgi:hypothetical protein
MRSLCFVIPVAFLLVVPHLAMAVTLTSVDGRSDCTGWSADIHITVRDGAFMGRLDYDIFLNDSAGAVVEEFVYGEMIDISGGPDLVLPVSGAFANALDGEYTLEASFTVYDVFPDGQNLSYGGFSVNLACGSAAGGDTSADEACAFPARFWSENPDAWPVESLTVAGETMDQARLLAMLEMRGNDLHMFLLVRETIAAKLNLAQGASEEIGPTVAAAEDFLATRWGARRGGKDQQEAMRLKNELFRYNRQGCPGSSGTGAFRLDGFDPDAAAEKAAVEFMSLGTVKALYR